MLHMNATLSVWQVIGSLLALAFVVAGGVYLYEAYKVKQKDNNKDKP